MVQRGGQDPRSFVFSVDDVTLAQVPTTAVRMLTRLRVKGFGLSMSNCGAGPSWLHQLARLPLSELKLDPRLVSGVSGDPKRTAALDAALESIRDAGLPVVADGCDSAADFDLLLALGCSEAQGRCVAQPMNGAGIVEWSRTAGAGGDAGHSDTA
jgi:EAL domain-containing protein (putative c-di-GMP-specific phosphodiesterase class I)